jgi:preprotein translocase subunit YajC
MYNFLMLEDPAAGSQWPLLLILGVFLIGMFAFTVLPQRRKQKQMAEMSARIKVGDKIKTIGGICGTIVGFDEENGVYTVLSGTSTFEIDRGCVYSMEMLGLKPAEPPVKVPEEVRESLPQTPAEPAVEKEPHSDEVKDGE